MKENISQFEVTMHDFVFDQCLESIHDLTEILDNLLLLEPTFFLDFLQHVPTITVLQHQVVVIRRLLKSKQLNYVRVVTRLQHLYLILQQLVKLPSIITQLPLMVSLRIVLMATTCNVS